MMPRAMFRTVGWKVRLVLCSLCSEQLTPDRTGAEGDVENVSPTTIPSEIFVVTTVVTRE